MSKEVKTAQATSLISTLDEGLKKALLEELEKERNSSVVVKEALCNASLEEAKVYLDILFLRLREIYSQEITNEKLKVLGVPAEKIAHYRAIQNGETDGFQIAAGLRTAGGEGEGKGG